MVTVYSFSLHDRSHLSACFTKLAQSAGVSEKSGCFLLLLLFFFFLFCFGRIGFVERNESTGPGEKNTNHCFLFHPREHISM